MKTSIAAIRKGLEDAVHRQNGGTFLMEFTFWDLSSSIICRCCKICKKNRKWRRTKKLGTLDYSFAVGLRVHRFSGCTKSNRTYWFCSPRNPILPFKKVFRRSKRCCYLSPETYDVTIAVRASTPMYLMARVD